MKKLLLSMLTFMIILSMIQVSAQNTTTVADGTATNSYVPIYGYYADAYLRSQTIYPSPMLSAMVGNTITSMTFYLYSAPVYDWGCPFVFQLGTTTNTDFSASSDFIQTDLIQVYAGPITIVNNQMTITFTEPFVYTGGNLLLDVHNTLTGNYSSASFIGLGTNANLSTQGNSYYSPDNIYPSGKTFIPKVTFTHVSSTSDCIPPRSSLISEVNPHGATLSWIPQNGQSSWQVYCDTGTVDNPELLPWITVTDTFYSFTGLDANTEYSALVRTSCGNQSSLFLSKSFWTSLEPVDFPFSCDFEDDNVNNSISIRNGNQVNKWFIGNAVNNTPNGEKALYVSNSDGQSNTYNNETTSACWAFFDANFPNANEFLLSFDWRVQGEGNEENNFDYLQVFVGPPTAVAAGDPSIPTGATSIGVYNRHNTWQTVNEVIPSSFSNSLQRVYFLWKNDYSSGTNPPAAVDNIFLDVVNCKRPDSLVISNITTNSVTIDIIPANSNISGWEIQFINGISDTIVSTSTATGNIIGNLNPSDYYTVCARSICNTGDTSIWSPLQYFHTECATALNVPQTWGFEEEWVTGSLSGQEHAAPLCWTVYDGGGFSPYYDWSWRHVTDQSFAHSGHGSAACYTDYATEAHNDWLITPQIALTGTQMLSFYAQRYDANTFEPEEISVWISNENITLAAPANATSHLPGFTRLFQTAIPEGAYQLYEIPLSGYSGNRYIAFVRGYTPHDGYYLRLDDVTIHEEPACVRPTNLHISSITAYETNIAWSPAENPVNLYYKPTNMPNFTLANSSPLSDTSFSLAGLMPATSYEVYLASICSDETEQNTQTISFTTNCLPEIITESEPFVENFNTLTSGIPDCWDNKTGTTTAEAYQWTYNPNGEIGACVCFNSYFNPSGRTNLLKTPPMDLSSLANPTLSFSYKNPSGGDFSIYLSTDGGITYPTAIVTGIPNSDEWTELQYELSNMDHIDNVIILFKGTSNYGNGDAYIYLDNVMVSEVSNCIKPNHISVTETTSNSIQLIWSGTANDISWDVAYGPIGFNFHENTTIVSTTDTTITIPDLTMGQIYDFYVRSNCGDDVSIWRGPVSAIPGSYTFGITGINSITSCGIIIYDNGGYDGHYSSNCDYILTIFPSDPDSLVSVSGVFAGEYTYDYLNIYDGITTDGDLLATISSAIYGVESGTQFNFGPVTSERGPLTLLFHSDVSVEYDGFEIIASCVAAPTCRKPYDLVTTHVAPNAASIEWSDLPYTLSYNVALSTVEDFNPDSCTTLFTTSANSYDFSNLASNSIYYVAVQADCGNGEVSSWSNIHPFMTSTDLATLPYFHDFEDANENANWVLINGTETNKWYIGQPAGETDSVLFISQDGTSASYNSSSTSSVWAYRDFDFGNEEEFILSFNWKAVGEGQYSDYDYLQVFIGSPNPISAGTETPPAEAVQLGNTLNMQASWQHFHTAINRSYANSTQRIYFLWHNDYFMGTDPAAVIDSFRIDVSYCAHPQNMTLADVQGTSADITFTKNSETDHEWQYLFEEGVFNPTDNYTPYDIYDTVIYLSGLVPNNEYSIFVRTACGDGSYSAWSEIFTFRTACTSISSLPFIENFDSYGTDNAYPYCWSRINTYSSIRPSITYMSYEGEGALYFFAGSGTYNMAITPEFGDSININSLQATFMYRATYDEDRLIVGVISDPTDFNTFLPVDTVYPDMIVSNWVEREVDFSQYNGEGKYIAFLNKYFSNYAYAYIDNLNINLIPVCNKPTSVTATAATTSSITLSWTPGGTESSWNVEYGPTGFTPGTGTILTGATNPMTINGLASSTTYDFYIQSACDEDLVSSWTIAISATTDCGVVTQFPYTENFDNISYNEPNAFPTCWSRPVLFEGFPYAVNHVKHSAPASLRFQSEITNHTTAATAPFAENIHNLKLSFWLKAEDPIQSGTIEIGVMSNPNDVSTFESIQIIQGQDSWTEFNISFDTTNATGSNKCIAFRQHSNSNNWYYWIDDVVISLNDSVINPTDPTVTTLAATAIDHNSATLNASISNPNNVTISTKGFKWKINGGTYNQIAGTGTDNTFTANLTGLSANTTYTFMAYIRYSDITVFGDEMTFTTAAEPCTVPTNLSISNMTHNSADVSWTAGGSETSWNLQLKSGNDEWSTDIPVDITPAYHFSNLNPATPYQVRVQAVCGNNNTSDWTTPVSFTTGTPCLAPDNLDIINITAHSATVSWTAGDNENLWKVNYKLSTASQWQEATVQQTTYEIEGLTPESAYDVRVKAVCATDNESDYISTSFTTSPDAINDMTLANSISLMPNPADNYIELRVNGNVIAKEAVVYNAFGQMIQTVQLTDNHARINLVDMAAGMYFIRVNGENTTATKKFIRK